MPGRSDISKHVSMRLRNETAEWIKNHKGRQIIEAVHDLYDQGRVYFDGDEICISRIKRFGNEFEGDDDEGRKQLESLNRQISEMRESLFEYKRKVAALESVAISGDLVKELDGMGKPYGMAAETLIREFVLMLNDGRIGLSAEGLCVGTVDECPFEWKEFVSACDEMSFEYDEAMRKLIPMLFRG